MILLIIGIGGGTSSGKTTLTSLLKDYFKNKISVINCDNYYFSRENISFEERKKINFDLPEAIDIEKLIMDINLLKKGEVVQQPTFSFITLLKEREKNFMYPSPILVVEGILIFYFEKLRKLFDIKIYLDVESDVKLARRIIRGTTICNMPIDYVIKNI